LPKVQREARHRPLCYAGFTTEIEMAYDQTAADLLRENEALKNDAERWRMIENHWSAADIRNNRDGSFKSMTITFKAAQLSDEQNRDKLRRAFDGATARPDNAKLTGVEQAPLAERPR
jgi:hypothetical protein